MDYTLQPKQKSEVQFNGHVDNDKNWAVPFVNAVKTEFDDRFDKIRDAYEKLMEEVHWNNIVYSVNFSLWLFRRFILGRSLSNNCNRCTTIF
jgi:hypothetical protein